jgi:hypothetical protein
MLTVFSTFVSFLMGGLPKILDFFQDKSDKSHELKLAQMQTERELQLAAAGFVAQERIEEIKLDEIRTQTASAEKVSLIDAQFFFLLVAIDAVIAYKGLTTGVEFTALADQLWDNETQALFASIIAFHFGGRAFGK